MFCEDKTYGLYTESANEIMELLKLFSSHPDHRVVVTLSHTSSVAWNLVNHIILLYKGRLIYEDSKFYTESFFAVKK